MLREMLLANPHELSLLKERNPPLAEELLSGDLGRSSFSLHEAVLIQGSHRFLAAWGTHCWLIDGAHRRHQLEALVAEFLSF